MITYKQFESIMTVDLKGNFCIEIEFSVDGSEKFRSCWMGRTKGATDIHQFGSQRNTADIYWFGLTPDGENAHDYSSFAEMSSAKLFDGKSLKDIWESITIISVDGCAPAERFAFYSRKRNDS